jgi:hypothetical protein
VKEVEDSQNNRKMGDIVPVDIPVEMMVYVDTDGEMTPRRLRYEQEGGNKVTISFAPEDTVARDDCNFVGIKEKKYICTAMVDGIRTTVEIRYRVADQTWRIFRFL